MNLRYIVRGFITSPVRAACNMPSFELYSDYLKVTIIWHMMKAPASIETTIYTPLDQAYDLAIDNFGSMEENRKLLKTKLRQDMEADYQTYTGHFRYVYPNYPRFQLFRSPALTRAHFRLATSHLNIGTHLKRIGMKAETYNCRYCQRHPETVWRLLRHHNYRSRFSLLELIRGSRGTEVDRLRLFRIVARIGL